MHLLCTDLDLKRLTDRTHQRCMQRLIHIRFRHGNIIFKSSRNRRINLMDNSQCRITVFDRIHNDTDCKQVINLIYCLILIDHLLINTEEMLYTSIYICFDPRIFHMHGHFIHNLLDKFLTLCFSGIDLIYKVKKYIGAYAAVMGGLDAIVFGGGIGLNSPLVRALSLEGLEFLGIRLDGFKNRMAIAGMDISMEDAPVRVFTVHTDEEIIVARKAAALLAER